MGDAKKSILIIEDEFIIAEDLAVSLRQQGYQVAVAFSDLEEAIVLSRQTLPDLILMDIKWQADFEWIKIANTVWEELGIPVAYITACSTDNLKALGVLRDTIFCLQKPYRERELYAVIEKALKKKRGTKK